MPGFSFASLWKSLIARARAFVPVAEKAAIAAAPAALPLVERAVPPSIAPIVDPLIEAEIAHLTQPPTPPTP